MKSSNRIRLAVVATLAAIPVLIRPTQAQNRIDTSGRALDANTQVGSGGYNLQNNNPVANAQTYQNAIATNNIGNGFAFRGRTVGGYNLGVGYTDPFAFRGLLPGQGVDQFVANSTGVPTMANPTASSSKFAQGPNSGLTYYGAINHGAPPPGGYEQGTYGFNYTPSEPVTQNPQDTRIGAINYSGAADSMVIPKPNELLLPGPVDTSANSPTQAQQLLAASPLYGMRAWQNSQNVQIGSGTANSAWQPGWAQTPLQQGFAPNLSTSMNQDRITQMQQEVLNVSGVNSINSNGAANFGSTQLQPLTPGGENSTFGQPLSPTLSNDSQLQSNNLTPQAGDVSTSQSNRQYLSGGSLPSPGQQSAQYALLQEQYQQYTSAHKMTDEQANQRFQQILKLRDLAKTNAEHGGNIFNPTTPTPAPNANAVPGPEQPVIPSLKPGLHATEPPAASQLKPGFTTMPSNLGGVSMPSASAPPIAIDSYATGIKAKGLADLIADAESKLQKQQYDKAIASFNTAIDVAPNNPMILMGRATAELGGGYFAQANADLHLAIYQDPAILMGQYDLQKHFGAERLKSLISDLKEISEASKDDAMHAFLLSYVYYNSHHVGQAADWLAIADHRAKGEDTAIIQMKKYWNFNEDQQPIAAPSTRPTMTK
jgi:tetratricopeptide (TPR) repeat protein